MRPICYWILLALMTSAPTTAEQQQPAAPFVLGYANKLSCMPGEEISFHLSSCGASVRMVIERQGGTNETVFEKADIACATHPVPDQASIGVTDNSWMARRRSLCIARIIGSLKARTSNVTTASAATIPSWDTNATVAK